MGVTLLLGCGFWQLGQGAYIPAKAWLAQELLQRAWYKTRATDSAHPPWPWADTWPLARLSAREGTVELIVLSGSSGRTLAFGPGHMSVSALPGEVGNAVIAGHRDTHFQFLSTVAVGDLLRVETPDGADHRYRIVALDVVDSRRGSLILDTPRPMLSLVTCYPFDSTDVGGPMRFIVSAEMVD